MPPTILDIVRSDAAKRLCVTKGHRCPKSRLKLLVLNESLTGRELRRFVSVKILAIASMSFKERNVPSLSAFEIARFRVDRIVLRLLRVLRRVCVVQLQGLSHVRVGSLFERKRGNNMRMPVYIGQITKNFNTKNCISRSCKVSRWTSRSSRFERRHEDDRVHVARFR